MASNMKCSCVHCELTQKLLPKSYYLSFINNFSAFVEEIMGANIEMMKQPAAGADFFKIIFEAKFGINFPPLFFTKIAQKGGS